VRVALILGCCCALLLSACGSATKTVVTTEPTSSTSPSSTTVAGCPPVTMPITPVAGAATSSASLLTNVSEADGVCVDNVTFDFTGKGAELPGYSLTYGTPPFSDSGSGAAVAVAGSAFIVVTVKPGYGYDFEAGKATYTGPKSIPVTNSMHVRSIVETGDYEGVLTWVIGLDAQSPFRVVATGAPRRLVVSVY